MNKKFFKPDVDFSNFNSPIFTFVEFLYSLVEDYRDYSDFVHYCFDWEANTLDKQEREDFVTLANNLYSLEIQISYESKQLELLIQTL